ncbi:MAG: undecaprenyl-diphosphatase UppP [Candidatus Marinimicrobia bacterium]|nr:undecaprenyl-diphosphatase UppP [Candidatus Neomarinimicrobiota bacterium]
MEYLKIIILAIIQGLTEFLPVSSSGHLALAEYLLGIESPGVTLEVFLHFGTFMSVAVIFWKDIVKILIAFFGNFWKVWKYPTVMKENEDFTMGIYIILSMIPAGIVGLLFEEQIDGLFDNILIVGIALIVTGTMLFLTQWAQNEKRHLKGWRVFLMGLAQAIAIIPGISRSGSTVSTGMFLGMPREKVAKFSFLMALPLIFGATIMKAKDAFATEGFIWSGIIIGTVTSFLFGYFAVKWLLRAIIKGRLYMFGFYCLIIGFLAIIFG